LTLLRPLLELKTLPYFSLSRTWYFMFKQFNVKIKRVMHFYFSKFFLFKKCFIVTPILLTKKSLRTVSAKLRLLFESAENVTSFESQSQILKWFMFMKIETETFGQICFLKTVLKNRWGQAYIMLERPWPHKSFLTSGCCTIKLFFTMV
jgi:hypothetical protein